MLRVLAGDLAFDAEDERAIAHAVDLAFRHAGVTLNDLVPFAFARRSKLRRAFAKWVVDEAGGAGLHAHVFNAARDSLGGLLGGDRSAARLVGIDMGEALDDPVLGPPVVAHVSRAIGRTAAATARGFVIFIDEAAKLLLNPGFRALAAEMFREYRKLGEVGGAVGLAFQDPAALLATGVAEAFVENATTLVFFPNSKVSVEASSPSTSTRSRSASCAAGRGAARPAGGCWWSSATRSQAARRARSWTSTWRPWARRCGSMPAARRRTPGWPRRGSDGGGMARASVSSGTRPIGTRTREEMDLQLFLEVTRWTRRTTPRRCDAAMRARIDGTPRGGAHAGRPGGVVSLKAVLRWLLRMEPGAAERYAGRLAGLMSAACAANGAASRRGRRPCGREAAMRRGRALAVAAVLLLVPVPAWAIMTVFDPQAFSRLGEQLTKLQQQVEALEKQTGFLGDIARKAQDQIDAIGRVGQGCCRWRI